MSTSGSDADGGGPLVIDIAGTTLAQDERERLLHPLCGGVVLFTRNYEEPAQLRELCAQLRALRDPPLLITVDHEGGRVQRFRDGFVRLPPAAVIGQRWDDDRGAALALARCAGQVMAGELRAAGVDLSFAPVIDVGGVNTDVIGDRAFHDDPGVVTELAGAFVAGMHRAGMAAVGKHFPGHGGSRGDSHELLPRDERALVSLEARDLVPWRALASTLDAAMTAHVHFPRIDDEVPTFSRFWLGEVLRGRLGFGGVVFSDDLTMQGAKVVHGGVVERAGRALEAGCDALILCKDPPAVDELLSAGIPQPAGQVRRPLSTLLPSAAHEPALLAEAREAFRRMTESA